ncbi:MerR family DNA-binding transcriptional regulator [Actinomadura luteofluorescens]|uniref:MerR family DNA-binding transcriptional regulator n=1 Tax=Actinomadura luteofluorescens TaxID=46163 RepID=UPI001FEC15F5|nr:MerR family DNA-binding transcriptional regulator [Actinomadura luteofluorescens]
MRPCRSSRSVHPHLRGPLPRALGAAPAKVAEQTGLSVHALRFYAREGLMVGPVQRTIGGRRRYTFRMSTGF